MPFFIPTFDHLISEIGLVPATVFGIIWRYTRMSDHICRASAQTLATRLGVHRATVMRATLTLLDAGLLEDLSPGLHNHPHRLQPSPRALELIDSPPAINGPLADTESDSRSEPDVPAVAASDGSCNPGQQPVDAHSDMNQTLLRNKEKNEYPDPGTAAFYQEKVEYINGQILTFYRCRSIRLCRFHSFAGSRFLISHPDPFFLRTLNGGFQSMYEKTLTLFIPDPGLKVAFVLRELRSPR